MKVTAKITNYGIKMLNKNRENHVNIPFSSARVVLESGDVLIQYMNNEMLPVAEEIFFCVNTKELVIDFLGSGIVTVEV